MSRILVVDDSEVDRRLVGGLLQRTGNYDIQYACNGAEALDHIEQSPPDVVITDLQMPIKDGLELVTEVRLRHAKIPVVLITAHGSELLAAEALEQGAASYVPKSQLADKLAETVQDVLAMVRADRSYERLIQCLNESTFDFTLDNDPALIEPLVDLIQQMVSAVGLCDVNSRFRIGIALKEALSNALYRGNLEIDFDQMKTARREDLGDGSANIVQQRLKATPYADRRLHVHARINREEVRFTVRDEGPGFDVKAITPVADLASLPPEAGRGLVLMRAFMDEVLYNTGGNEVTLVKRREAARPLVTEA